jgi:hypothetical protein
MKDGNQFVPFAPDTVWNDVGRGWNDEFPSPQHSSRPTHFRLYLQEVNRVQDSLCDEGRVLPGIPGDEFS